MIILGLTGSIGMGKTTAAEAFRRFGVPVYDADAEIHRLMEAGGAAVAGVSAAFPGVATAFPGADRTDRPAIDRSALAGKVFGDEAALGRLEKILHPLARRAKVDFLAAAARRRRRLVVLDIPLLLETGGGGECDAVVVVTAPPFVQKKRVLQRPGMTIKRLNSILKRQMPDAEKRRRADFIVHTGLGRGHSLRAIAGIVKTMTDKTCKRSHGKDHA